VNATVFSHKEVYFSQWVCHKREKEVGLNIYCRWEGPSRDKVRSRIKGKLHEKAMIDLLEEDTERKHG
jgi:hypothetical protein